MSNPVIKIHQLRLQRDSDVPLPRYMTNQASGMDLCTNIDSDQVLEAGTIAILPTGLAVALPEGYEAQIRPRSGLASRHGITLVNTPGTIDADYRGEIKIPVINLGKKPYTIRRGDRIAQMVIQRVCHATLDIVHTLEETERSDGGFGHTGT